MALVGLSCHLRPHALIVAPLTFPSAKSESSKQRGPGTKFEPLKHHHSASDLTQGAASSPVLGARNGQTRASHQRSVSQGQTSSFSGDNGKEWSSPELPSGQMMKMQAQWGDGGRPGQPHGLERGPPGVTIGLVSRAHTRLAADSTVSMV